MIDYANPLGIVGLARPNPKPPRVDPKYATFRRRLLAMTSDMMVMLAAGMAADSAFGHFYKEVPVDWLKLWTGLYATYDPSTQLHLLSQTLVESGFLARWIWDNVMQTLILSLYFGVCWHVWSATPGKMLLRMKIVDAETGAPMSDRQIMIRLAGYGVSAFFAMIGFFWIHIDKRRQGWHDKMAGTVVVR